MSQQPSFDLSKFSAEDIEKMRNEFVHHIESQGNQCGLALAFILHSHGIEQTGTFDDTEDAKIMYNELMNGEFMPDSL